MKKVLLALILIAMCSGNAAEAGRFFETGFDVRVVPTGDYREQIKAMPIESRPYRPFHFYGNSIRRKYYRGTYLPVPKPVTDRLGRR